MTEVEPNVAPVFSVIIPVYNRSDLILRAIRSVLSDPSRDVEVIVVDDASTDGTADCVASVNDSRLRLLRLTVNGGRCPARNLGAREARGEWLIFLDSDDELAPGSLADIRRRSSALPADVGKILFACRYDSGAISPSPALDGRIVDYVGYLKWTETTVGRMSEALPCTRRSAFLQCPYPEARGWFESIHELDFVRQHRVQLCPEVVRLYHLDAQSRLMTPDSAAVREGARGGADHAEAVLLTHGADMRKYAPERWMMLAREAALYNFFAGNRSRGIRDCVTVLRRAPVNLRIWAVLIAGGIAPQLLRKLWTIRRTMIVS